VLYANWTLPQIISIDIIGAVIASITVAVTKIPEIAKKGRKQGNPIFSGR
jgi:DHA3 family macrolide efflux protein-like MFS transporter